MRHIKLFEEYKNTSALKKWGWNLFKVIQDIAIDKQVIEYENILLGISGAIDSQEMIDHKKGNVADRIRFISRNEKKLAKLEKEFKSNSDINSAPDALKAKDAITKVATLSGSWRSPMNLSNGFDNNSKESATAIKAWDKAANAGKKELAKAITVNMAGLEAAYGPGMGKTWSIEHRV
jgi:hypothetical protein